MNRVSTLLNTPSVLLQRFDHPPGAEHRDPEREIAVRDSINFVDGGAFRVEIAGASHRLASGALFLTASGMEFACAHEEDVPSDRCFCVTFSDQAVDDLRSAGVPALRPPVGQVGQRQEFLRRRLLTSGAGQEVRMELLAGALYESLTAIAPPAAALDVGASALARRVERALDRIDAEYDRELTLRDLAATAGLSMYHFARLFRQFVGLPPHRYLLGVRLRQAAIRLEQGAAVTTACFDTGFGSLSHFITAFRRRFGVTPSATRRGARYPALRAAVAAPVWRRP